MMHHVQLVKLPDNLEFPEHLQERVWYDESQQQLVFDGFMSKATFDRLEGLHQDFDYRLALTDLFRIAVPENQQQPARRLPLLWLAAGLTLVLLVSGLGFLGWFAS